MGIDGTEIFCKISQRFLFSLIIEKHHKSIEIEDTVLACFFEGILKIDENKEPMTQ